jgi:hypothetical protein
MQELTQPLEQQPGLNPGCNRAAVTERLDFEKDKSPQYQRQTCLLSQLCAIQEDMQGAGGLLDGLFGM